MGIPPYAPQTPQPRDHHGDHVVDNYEWLRDSHSQHTLDYLAAENAWTEQETAHLSSLREDLFNEISARTQHTDMSVPTRHGSWWYYTRTEEQQQYGIHCRCPVDKSGTWTPPSAQHNQQLPGEEILLNSNTEAESHNFFALGAFSISADDTWLAYSVDTQGDERFHIFVKDLTSGQVYDSHIADAAPGATWSADCQYLFYTTVNEAWRPDTIWRHHIGVDSDDEAVYHEPDERYFIGIGLSQTEDWLMITASSKITSEVRVLPANNPTGSFSPVWHRREGVEYGVEHVRWPGGDEFWVLHNDGAEDFTLVRIPVGETGANNNGHTIISHQAGRRLEDIDVFNGYVLVSYRQDALAKIGLLRLPAGDDQQIEPDHLEHIEFDAELYTSGVGANAQWDQPVVRVAMTSFISPPRIYDYTLATGELTLLKQMPVLGGFDPADYVQYRLWALADDGVQVPISVVAHRDTVIDKSTPTLLYGYGAYEISVDPAFSIARLSLLDRGMVFAVAHVRGGGELGRQWYEQGKLLNKRNSFTDFISCAQYLIANNWTSEQCLIAEGGSAGGLLMGAVANLAPQLFAGIVANVPFVDPLTSILDPSLPLTVIEWDEWGNPLESPDVYEYMKSYSPYENVGTHDYPALMVITSLHDTRVLYVEPAKWVAKLRATATGNNPILLKTEMNAGHGGVSGRYHAWRERAWEMAWIIDTASKREDNEEPKFN